MHLEPPRSGIFLLKFTLVYGLLNFILLPANAQNLEAIGKEKPVKISGSLGTTQTFYGVSGIPNRRPPYQAFVNGSLTVNIYEWSIPFSVSWSNMNRTVLRQPFNRYGVSPKWRWITTHIGYRSMTFSPYTLAGYTFLGGGVDLTPGIFRISAMYGRLNKAVAEDTLSGRNEVPSFKRMGMGGSVGLEKGSNFIKLIWFKAKDDPLSIPYTPEKSNILPAENMVVALNAQKQLGKRTVFAFEYAKSAYTRDLRAERTEPATPNIFNPFFPVRSSTQFFNAFKSSLTYNADFYSIGLSYERIDPEYRTLGAYFFNNDLENLTIVPSVRILKQRMNISGNVGIQRNNVDHQSLNTIKRILGSANITYVPNQRWSFAAQYSNFKTYNKISNTFNQFQNLDTLNFYQVNESGSFNTGYNSTGQDKRHGVNLNLSYQIANQTQGEQVTSNTSRFYNGNLSYRYSLLPLQLTVSAGVNANKNAIAGMSSLALGPTSSVAKTFFDKKLRASFTASYNTLLTEGISNGRAINMVLGGNYNFQKRNNFTLNVIVLNKHAKTATASRYTEFTGNFGYSYTF